MNCGNVQLMMMSGYNGWNNEIILFQYRIIVGLAFRNVSAWAAIIGVVTGVLVYAVFSFKLYGLFGISPDEGFGATLASVHYIHYMFVTLVVSIGTALLSNLIVFGRKAELTIGNSSPAPAA